MTLLLLLSTAVEAEDFWKVPGWSIHFRGNFRSMNALGSDVGKTHAVKVLTMTKGKQPSTIPDLGRFDPHLVIAPFALMLQES